MFLILVRANREIGSDIFLCSIANYGHRRRCPIGSAMQEHNETDGASFL